ncbi:MAG: 3-oxoacyl-[acyl-carrier-protein] synthase III C-terminal domain-containing protein, partial [Anaerolineales bacterium]
LAVPAGGSKLPASELTLHNGQHFIHMDGREVFRFATRVMASATQEALTASQLSVNDLSIVIPHQANYRIIEAAARGLKLPIDKFYINLDRYGNTSTASIPIATVEAFETGRLHPGDKMVFVGFGAGLTWGALAAQWTGPRPVTKAVHPERYRLLGRIRSFVRRVIRRIEGILFGKDNVV